MYRCYIKGSKQCSRCKRPYCSMTHSKQDKAHKVVCYTHIEDRFKNMVIHLSKMKETQQFDMSDYGLNNIQLSGINYRYSNYRYSNNNTSDEVYYNIFSNSTKNSLLYTCVICFSVIEYNGPLDDLSFKFNYNDCTIYCTRCVDCNKKRERLCPNTFLNAKSCTSKQFQTLCLCLNRLEKTIKLIHLSRDLRGIFYKLIKRNCTHQYG
jgi:hypothetical protein